MAAESIYLTDVLLLCTQCKEPIKARINTANWLRVEWIGPEGQCLKCYQRQRSTQTGVSNDANSLQS